MRLDSFLVNQSSFKINSESVSIVSSCCCLIPCSKAKFSNWTLLFINNYILTKTYIELKLSIFLSIFFFLFLLQKRKEYYEKNKDVLIQKSKDYYKKNKEEEKNIEEISTTIWVKKRD